MRQHFGILIGTPVGIMAGVTAGSTVWAYAPPLAPTDVLVQAGAKHVFAHMNDLRIPS